MEVSYSGNRGLLSLRKEAFLCTRMPQDYLAVVRCLDWARGVMERGAVVMSGYQSEMEKKVVEEVLAEGGLGIVVLARCLYSKPPQRLLEGMSSNRLLFISTAPRAARNDTLAAHRRNAYMAELADWLVFGDIQPGRSLEGLYQAHKGKSEVLSNYEVRSGLH